MTRLLSLLLSLLLSSVASAGILLGPESLLSPSTSAQRYPAVAATTDTALVVWTEGDPGNARIEGTRILPYGTHVHVAIANEDVAGSAPRIASDGSSSFLVVWMAGGNGGLRAVQVHADGTTGEIRHLTDSAARNPSIAFIAGAYVIAWEVPQDLNPLYYYGMGTGVVAQRFDRTGAPLDVAPQLIAGESYFPPAFMPAVAADGDQVLIVWTSGLLCKRVACQHIAAYDLNARLFAEDLSPRTDVFSISADSDVNEVGASVLPTAEGWFVAWTGWRGVGNGGEVSDRGWTTLTSSGMVTREVRPPLIEPVFNAGRIDGYVRRDAAAVAACGNGGLVSTLDSLSHAVIVECAPYVDESVSFDADEIAMANLGTGALVVYTRSFSDFGSPSPPQVLIRDITVDPRQRRRAVR